MLSQGSRVVVATWAQGRMVDKVRIEAGGHRGRVARIGSPGVVAAWARILLGRSIAKCSLSRGRLHIAIRYHASRSAPAYWHRTRAQPSDKSGRKSRPQAAAGENGSDLV